MLWLIEVTECEAGSIILIIIVGFSLCILFTGRPLYIMKRAWYYLHQTTKSRQPPYINTTNSNNSSSTTINKMTTTNFSIPTAVAITKIRIIN